MALPDLNALSLAELELEHQRRDAQVAELRQENGEIHKRIIAVEAANFKPGDPALHQVIGGAQFSLGAK